jgi:hypothetical protein
MDRRATARVLRRAERQLEGEALVIRGDDGRRLRLAAPVVLGVFLRSVAPGEPTGLPKDAVRWLAEHADRHATDDVERLIVQRAVEEVAADD